MSDPVPCPVDTNDVYAALRRLLFSLLLLVSLPLAAASQQPIEPESLEQADTAALSPRGAFLRSLVLPGWGQSYVGSPGRGAFYFAAEAGSLWMVYKSRQQLRGARELARHLRDTGVLDPEQPLGLVRSRETQLEDWVTLSLFFLLFAGADAYVAAQLADFEESFGVRPTDGGGLEMEARLPLGRRR